MLTFTELKILVFKCVKCGHETEWKIDRCECGGEMMTQNTGQQSNDWEVNDGA